jgi:hypothetical protein
VASQLSEISFFRRIDVSKQRLSPGEKAPWSGQYGIVDRNGKRTGPERTIVKGGTMPPTPKPGQGFVMNDPTKNKAGRGK